MLISLGAIVCTVMWLRRTRRLVALLLLVVSAWMLLVWFFMASIAILNGSPLCLRVSVVKIPSKNKTQPPGLGFSETPSHILMRFPLHFHQRPERQLAPADAARRRC